MRELLVNHYLIPEPVGGRGGCVGAVVKHYISYPGTCNRKRGV